MGKLLGLTQCPVFLETGDAYQTVPFGTSIKDYPKDGRTGAHFANDITRWADGRSTTATIVALEDGIIYAQRKWVREFNADVPAGNCVYIRHPNGMVTKYLHLKYGSVPDWVKDNVEVKKGQVIGFMGSTGESYGAHLHFQVETADGVCIDPEPYLTGKKTILGKSVYQLVVTKEFETEEAAKLVQNALTAIGLATVIKGNTLD